MFSIPLAIAFCVAPVPSNPVEEPSKKQKVEVIAVCTDNSQIKVTLLDEELEFKTKHGTLKIKMADVKKIEFATRISADMTSNYDKLIKSLASSDFAIREEATKTLKLCDERVGPAITAATKSGDPEVVRRAEDILKTLKMKYNDTQLTPKPYDIIYIDDSKICGHFIAEHLKIETEQFGKQELKLYHIIAIKTSFNIADTSHVPDAPTNLSPYATQYGKELMFSLIGTTPNGTMQNQLIWGTDIYTIDSNISIAAVHSGIVKPGQKTVVRLRILQSPIQFEGTSRNSISSIPYGTYTPGAYEFIK